MGASSSKSELIDIISQLQRNDVSASDLTIWDRLWKTSLDVDGIFELISPVDIRKLIKDRPGNVAILFSQAVAQLFQVVETPYPVYFEQAMTCTRILARIVPFMLESDSPEIRDLLWKPRATPALPVGEVAEEDGDPAAVQSEPLAVVLVNSVYHLLFLPDFTIEDPNIDFKEEDLFTHRFKSALMWAPGVGSPEKSIVYSSQYDTTRVDVLRLMIALFSDSLYQRPEKYDSCASLWLEIATSVDVPYSEVVFDSLMNVVLGYDPVGWGVPYGAVFSTDTAKALMASAAQVLVVLLDFGHPMRTAESPAADAAAAAEAAQMPYVNPRDVHAPGYNVFRKYLSSIESPDELNFVFRGFARLLNNVHESQSVVLPYSITRIDIEQELLILLWKCLEENPSFMPFVLKSCDVTQLLIPICYFLLEARKDPSKLGLMYLCTFSLLKLSGERNFGVSLNRPYFLRLPVDVPLFSGTHADLLIVTLHKLVVSGIDRLSALYNCFLTIICNISPYCKVLSTVSSVKLVNLFQLFTSPRFLYAAEGNHIYVSLLLETFNNIIQYQYEGNANLIYAIVKRRELFDSVAGLTLPAAIKVATETASGMRPEQRREPSTGASKPAAYKPVPDSEVAPEGQVTASTLLTTQPVERKTDSDGEVIDTTMAQDAAAESNSKAAKPTADLPASFVPTQAWLESVKGELPLNTIMRLLKYLTPQLEEISVASAGSIDEQRVLDFIQRTTLVGLLPVPHPIIIRKYQPNKYTSLWFSAFLWGVIFMHNQDVPLFDGKNIKLFIVQTVSRSTQMYDVDIVEEEVTEDRGEQKGVIEWNTVFFPLFEGDNLVGKLEKCGVFLNHKSVSDRHAIISLKDGTFSIMDLDSTNGTYLDKNYRTAETTSSWEKLRFGNSWVLLDGCDLRFGMVRAKFSVLPPTATSPVEPFQASQSSVSNAGTQESPAKINVSDIQTQLWEDEEAEETILDQTPRKHVSQIETQPWGEDGETADEQSEDCDDKTLIDTTPSDDESVASDQSVDLAPSMKGVLTDVLSREAIVLDIYKIDTAGNGMSDDDSDTATEIGQDETLHATLTDECVGNDLVVAGDKEPTALSTLRGDDGGCGALATDVENDDHGTDAKETWQDLNVTVIDEDAEQADMLPAQEEIMVAQEGVDNKVTVEDEDATAAHVDTMYADVEAEEAVQNEAFTVQTTEHVDNEEEAATEALEHVDEAAAVDKIAGNEAASRDVNVEVYVEDVDNEEVVLDQNESGVAQGKEHVDKEEVVRGQNEASIIQEDDQSTRHFKNDAAERKGANSVSSDAVHANDVPISIEVTGGENAAQVQETVNCKRLVIDQAGASAPPTRKAAAQKRGRKQDCTAKPEDVVIDVPSVVLKPSKRSRQAVEVQPAKPESILEVPSVVSKPSKRSRQAVEVQPAEPVPEPIRIVFSKVDVGRAEKLYARTIGAEIVDSADLATHVITTEAFARTPKVMVALNRGVRYIVSAEWLIDSAEHSKAIDLSSKKSADMYIISDTAKEKLWKFNLKKTLAMSRGNLFGNMIFYVTDGVYDFQCPARADMLRIVESGRGKLMDSHCCDVAEDDLEGATIILLSNEVYINSNKHVPRLGVPSSILRRAHRGPSKGVYLAVEFLFVSILRQSLSYDEDVLVPLPVEDEEAVGVTAGPGGKKKSGQYEEQEIREMSCS